MLSYKKNKNVWTAHRNQTISRKGANIISRRPSHGHLARRCCPQAFLRIFPEVTYIRTVGNSSLLKIYTLPNHTITIGVCILETQLGCPAKLISIRNNRNWFRNYQKQDVCFRCFGSISKQGVLVFWLNPNKKKTTETNRKKCWISYNFNNFLNFFQHSVDI
jgi:hypothetical protein